MRWLARKSATNPPDNSAAPAGEPIPAQVQPTAEQLRELDRQALPWRVVLMVLGAVVLIATGVLVATSFMMDVTEKVTTDVFATNSASADNSVSPAPSSPPSPSASPSAGTNSTSKSLSSSDSKTIKTTHTDGARPSDTVLGLAFALGLLLLLTGAFFNRVTKLSAAGTTVELSLPPLPPATQAAVQKKAAAKAAELQLDPEKAEKLVVGSEALARTINVSSSVDAETLAELAIEGTARSLNFT